MSYIQYLGTDSYRNNPEETASRSGMLNQPQSGLGDLEITKTYCQFGNVCKNIIYGVCMTGDISSLNLLATGTANKTALGAS